MERAAVARQTAIAEKEKAKTKKVNPTLKDSHLPSDLFKAKHTQTLSIDICTSLLAPLSTGRPAMISWAVLPNLSVNLRPIPALISRLAPGKARLRSFFLVCKSNPDSIKTPNLLPLSLTIIALK